MATLEAPEAPILRVGIDDRMRPAEYFTFGLQHLLALTGIWLFPGLIGAALKLSADQVGYIVQMCFITTGVVTVLQSAWLLRLPIVQGPTAAFFVAILIAGQRYGLGTAYASMMVAGLIVIALAIPIRGRSAIGFLSRYMMPPVVYGTLLVIIGAQLASIGLPNWLGPVGSPGYPGFNLVAAVLTVLAVLAFMLLGKSGWIRRAAFLAGVIVGALFYALFGHFNAQPILTAPPVGVPHPFAFGFHVAWPVVALMLAAFLQAVTEAIGMYNLVGGWGNQTISSTRASQGILGEAIGCTLGAILGGIATTSYPENVGIIRVSGIGSRFVTLSAGILAIILGFLPKIGVAIAVVPGAVLSGASTVLWGIIAVSGIQMLARVHWDEWNLAVAATAFIVSLGTMFLPPALVKTLAPAWQSMLTQPMLVGAVLLVVLNALVNQGLRRWLKPNASAP